MVPTFSIHLTFAEIEMIMSIVKIYVDISTNGHIQIITLEFMALMIEHLTTEPEMLARNLKLRNKNNSIHHKY